MKNFTNATTERLIAVLKFIFSTETIVPLIYITESTAYFVATIGRKLSRNEKAILTAVDSRGRRIIEKPVGVGMGFGEFDGDNVFSFADDPNGKGFGDFFDDSVGGAWASIINP
jgi:hypothetical protein